MAQSAIAAASIANMRVGMAPTGIVLNASVPIDASSNGVGGVAIGAARDRAAAATARDGRIYAIGGINSTGVTTYNAVEAYDPISNTWTTVTPRPTARYGLAATIGSDGRMALDQQTGTITHDQIRMR